MNTEKLDQLARHDGVIYIFNAPLGRDSTVTRTTTKWTDELGDPQVHALALALTDHGAAHPKQGITRTTIGKSTIVVTPNEAVGEVITVVVPTGHPFVKSLARSVRRYFKASPIRRQLARPVTQPEPELGEPRVIGGDHVSPWPATEQRKTESEATQ